MNDLVIFGFLQDTTVPIVVRNNLKKAFDTYNKDRVDEIVEEIVLVKTTNAILKEKK